MSASCNPTLRMFRMVRSGGEIIADCISWLQLTLALSELETLTASHPCSRSRHKRARDSVSFTDRVLHLKVFRTTSTVANTTMHIVHQLVLPVSFSNEDDLVCCSLMLLCSVRYSGSDDEFLLGVGDSPGLHQGTAA